MFIKLNSSNPSSTPTLDGASAGQAGNSDVFVQASGTNSGATLGLTLGTPTKCSPNVYVYNETASTYLTVTADIVKSGTAGGLASTAILSGLGNLVFKALPNGRWAQL